LKDLVANWDPAVLEAVLTLDKKRATALKCCQFSHKHFSS